MIKRICYFLAVVFVLIFYGLPSLFAASEQDRQTARVLLVTGIDHPAHDWRQTAPALADVLRKDGRLNVHVVEDPNFLSSPKINSYDVIVLHFMNW